MLVYIYIPAIQRDIYPMPGFLLLAIGIGQLADKMRRVSPLGPSLGDLGPNRTGGPADLRRKRIFLFFRIILNQFKNIPGQLLGDPINAQIPLAFDIHHRLPNTVFK